MATFNELREALQTSNVGALIAKRIDPRLVDLKRLEDPLRGALPVVSWDTPTYFWNQANKFPFPQAVVETPPTSGAGSVGASQSNYIQKSVGIGHAQTNGDVGKFAVQTAHASVENLLDLEIRRSGTGLGWLETMFHIYGSAAGTSATYRPQWDGFHRQIDPANILMANGGYNSGAGSTLSLNDFDNLIDQIRVRVAGPLPDMDFFFLTSQPMLSETGRLLRAAEQFFAQVTMQARRDDGIVGHPVVNVPGGVEVPSYRGIPLVATSFQTPTYGQFTAPTLGSGGTDGTFTGTPTVHVSMRPITQYGPMYASADASQALGATEHLTGSWSTPAPTDFLGQTIPILLYEVYTGAAAGSMSLRGLLPATDDQDDPVTSFIDTGATLLANGRTQCPGVIFGAVGSVTPANSGDGKNKPTITTPASGYVEDLLLINRNADFVAVPTVTEVMSEILAPVNLRTIQYAIGSDKCLAVRAGAFIAKATNLKTV